MTTTLNQLIPENVIHNGEPIYSPDPLSSSGSNLIIIYNPSPPINLSSHVSPVNFLVAIPDETLHLYHHHTNQTQQPTIPTNIDEFPATYYTHIFKFTPSRT
ncbi:unnamed protein product [Ambrosiozyma monospora]|uniref:Unnamed protein product n=1 Tax=Ambrosiozyma monospora TaxID=43982 RepID=A0A9W6YLN2_AMBMO|nr:unnamed protein product [Ambrosiozyma monospora]